MPQQKTHFRPRTDIHFDHPRMYRVIMHNDDFTTMEFVVMVLKTVFFKPEAEAEQLMLTVHQKGRATVGIFTLDIAVSKCQKAMDLARKEGFPFRLTWEPELDNPT